MSRVLTIKNTFIAIYLKKRRAIESEWSCTCAMGIDFTSVSTMFRMEKGTVLTVAFVFHCITCSFIAK